MTQAMVTQPGEGLSFTTTPTDSMTFLCQGDAEMPDVMIENFSPGDGPPLHSHPWAGWDVVVRGQVRVSVDGETTDVAAGGFFYTPPESVHAFMAIGDGPAQVVGFQWPGGFHVAYAGISEVFNRGGEPDFDALAEVCRVHDITLHGPPLAVLEAQGGPTG